jgi:DNA mismatch repair protein MutL
MKIKVLSEDTINKIAAGEVIERPASVVKELVENSIDAGASEVIIEVTAGGKNLIRVTDNGIGMDKEDAVLAFSRHATSKINSAEDLFKINTLGFRGEALPSIAGISETELITRAKEKDSAVKIQINGGKFIEVKETGAPNGTATTVKNLFYNTPARRKFLKSNATEASHIINVVSQYALVYLKCGFRLKHNEENLVEIFVKDSLSDRISVLYGKEVSEGAMKIEYEKDGIKIRGYAGNPDLTYPTRSHQFVFVNKRPITNRAISYAIFSSYENLVPKGRFPAVFLFIDISPGSIDVNVHPAKKEIRFEDDKMIQEIVRASIMNSLSNKQNISLNAESQNMLSGNKYAFNTSQVFSASCNSWEAKEFGSFLDAGFTPKITQVHNSFIINETEDGLEIIDQHAVHERIIYEKIKSVINNKGQENQRLLIPINIELTPLEEKILKEHLGFFAEIGFNIEEFGTRTIIIDTIPSVMDKVDIAKFIKDVLSEITENEKAVSQETVKDGIIKMAACRSAVMQGDKLDSFKMNELLKNWRELKFPYTCPHGRPAVIKITKKELEKKFQRS